MPASRLRIGLVVAAVLAGPALADWKDDYARGLEAVRDGRWSEASRLMESALAGNAQPAQRLRLYGQRYEVYAPQHYLGLAALRRGDCAAALRYWDAPANRSFVSGNNALAGVEAGGRSQCGTALASESKPPPKPSPAPVVVASEGDRGAPTSNTPAASTRPDPVPAKPTAPPIAQAPATPAPSPPTSRPAPVVEAPRPAGSAAGDLLRPVVDAYLAGRYAEVLRLTTKPATEASAGWHLQTLRAASAWQLSQLSSESDEAAATARAATTAARKIDPARRPDATFYPPRFLKFYDAS